MKLFVIYTKRYLDTLRANPESAEYKALSVAKEAVVDHYMTVHKTSPVVTTWITYTERRATTLPSGTSSYGNEILVVGPARHDVTLQDTFDWTYVINSSVMNVIVPLLRLIDHRITLAQAGLAALMQDIRTGFGWSNPPPGGGA